MQLHLRSNTCSLHGCALPALAVYTGLALTGFAAILVREPSTLIGRAAEPPDDKQAQRNDQNPEDAVDHQGFPYMIITPLAPLNLSQAGHSPVF